MMQGLEPVLLVSDVPGDVAAVIGTAAFAIITGLASFVSWLVRQLLEESRKGREVSHDLVDAVRENTREIRDAFRRTS